MKTFVTILGGFCLTLLMFAGGAATAILLVNAEPVADRQLNMDTSALWTSKAVSLDRNAQNLQRLPAVQGKPAPAREPDRPTKQPPDPLTTATVGFHGETSSTSVSTESAHADWCLDHYRSYDPSDNSYNAYSGIRRQCASPYGAPQDIVRRPGAAEASLEASAEYVSALGGGTMPSIYVDAEHLQSCLSRYRSYRAEDNTYQPFGGGPRQKCE